MKSLLINKDTYPNVTTKICFNCSGVTYLKADRSGCVLNCNYELGSYTDAANKACIRCPVTSPITKSNGFACVSNCSQELGSFFHLFNSAYL